jgi:TorA maturation chaperone TorD
MLAYRYSVYDLLRRIFLWQFPLELFSDLAKASQGEQNGKEPACSPEAPFRAYLSGLETDDLQARHRDIHIEYTRLFVGPHHLPAPPYESVYRSPERLMMQDETIDVRSIYAKNGFRVARINQEPDDTIGIELEFMCAMSKASADALVANNRAKLADLISTQRQFCDNHLSKWVPDFCKDIIDNSTCEFWKSVAAFTRSFLEEDFTALNALQIEIEGATRSSAAEPSVP